MSWGIKRCAYILKFKRLFFSSTHNTKSGQSDVGNMKIYKFWFIYHRCCFNTLTAINSEWHHKLHSYSCWFVEAIESSWSCFRSSFKHDIYDERWWSVRETMMITLIFFQKLLLDAHEHQKLLFIFFIHFWCLHLRFQLHWHQPRTFFFLWFS